jgi:hypothetical protein
VSKQLGNYKLKNIIEYPAQKLKVVRLLNSMFILVEWVNDVTLESIHLESIELQVVGYDADIGEKYIVVPEHS